MGGTGQWELMAGRIEEVGTDGEVHGGEKNGISIVIGENFEGIW